MICHTYGGSPDVIGYLAHILSTFHVKYTHCPSSNSPWLGTWAVPHSFSDRSTPCPNRSRNFDLILATSSYVVSQTQIFPPYFWNFEYFFKKKSRTFPPSAMRNDLLSHSPVNPVLISKAPQEGGRVKSISLSGRDNALTKKMAWNIQESWTAKWEPHRLFRLAESSSNTSSTKINITRLHQLSSRTKWLFQRHKSNCFLLCFAFQHVVVFDREDLFYSFLLTVSPLGGSKSSFVTSC